jgi:hypothetical protein
MTSAFVLSGGGSLGAVQAGMLVALAERGISPDLLVGSSVGAISAAWVASRPGPDGRRIWVRSGPRCGASMSFPSVPSPGCSACTARSLDHAPAGADQTETLSLHRHPHQPAPIRDPAP